MREGVDGDGGLAREKGRVTGTGGLSPGRSKAIVDIFGIRLEYDNTRPKPTE